MLDVLVQELLRALTLVIASLAGMAIAYGVRVGVAYLKTKISAEQYAFLQTATATIVRFVEQTSLWDSVLKEGSAKKERAMAELIQWAEARGLPITASFASKLIEEAVNVMNSELADLPSDIPVEG